MAYGDFMYHVMRHTDDQHNGGEHTEIRGTYWTLDEANDAARHDLLREWSQDFFEEYEEEVDEDDGTVRIEAHCPEGEEMSVYVEKAAAPPKPGAPEPLKANLPRTSDALWIILVVISSDQDDDGSQVDLGNDAVYESLFEANEAAYDIFREKCHVEAGQPLDPDIREENRGSQTKPYSAYTHSLIDDYYSVKVEVRKVNLRRDPQGNQAAVDADGRRQKRARVESPEVTVISD
jgi:hypothetical protein